MENYSQLINVILAVAGLQTAIMGIIFSVIWLSLCSRLDKVEDKIDKLDSKLSQRIDKLTEVITDIDRRVCRMEGAIANKDCCMLNNKSNEKAS